MIAPSGDAHIKYERTFSLSFSIDAHRKARELHVALNMINCATSIFERKFLRVSTEHVCCESSFREASATSERLITASSANTLQSIFSVDSSERI